MPQQDEHAGCQQSAPFLRCLGAFPGLHTPCRHGPLCQASGRQAFVVSSVPEQLPRQLLRQLLQSC